MEITKRIIILVHTFYCTYDKIIVFTRKLLHLAAIIKVFSSLPGNFMMTRAESIFLFCKWIQVTGPQVRIDQASTEHTADRRLMVRAHSDQ